MPNLTTELLFSSTHRSKISYCFKFGEFGDMDGQFTEPSSIGVTQQGEIVCVDSKNHRIQLFDSKKGTYHKNSYE